MINLCITGQAVSQVHDGVVEIGDGMKLKGIPKRPKIGYLSQLGKKNI